ncbi:MAG TPA: FHA domain-containing protein [Kiritimatiellia bacterium]|nr:FHA domain-containing protein [Kiritimatiellia bacterium]
MIYRLIVLTGPLKGQRITVDADPMTIGRDSGASIALPDCEVASLHARIEHRGSELYVHDLGTMNRIILNNREIQDARLKHGDILEVGRTRLLVQAVVQAEVMTAPQQVVAFVRRGKKRKLALAAVVLLLAGGTFALIHTRDDAHEPIVAQSADQPSPVLVDDLPAVDFTATAAEEEIQDSTSSLNSPLINVELRQIREDIAFIQQHLLNLNNSASPVLAITDDAKTADTESALSIDSIENIMQAARKAVDATDFDQAELLLDHLRIEHPDYIPAYELRAELYEAWGLPGRARDQWSAILQRSVESELFRKAHAERVRLSRAESQRLINAHDAVKIHNISQTRFRESTDYDEMRVVNIRLHYDRSLGPIDPDGVRLLVYFFERDMDTRRIELSKNQPFAEANLSGLHHDMGDQFNFSVSYIVPKGYYQKDHNTSRQQYFGFIARLHYFDRLVDEHARPPKLLEPAILESAGLSMQTAQSEGVLTPGLNPASN